MTDTPLQPELLAPAGNFEKLEIAVHFGADAIYLSGKNFSLRNFSGNFSDQELIEAVKFCHKHNVKVYLACNIYSRNHEQKLIETFLEKIGIIAPDAIIISDPGIILLSQRIIPHIDIHLSTQTNTTNYSAVLFWEKIGIKRVNLARELSLKEIKKISQYSKIETECFIHGAMCVSYSGRCLLSNFLSNRDSNRGFCSHPCRWKYSVVEEQRPNEYHSLMEDKRGSYIFNSKDLCMIEHIPELINAGISSFKIEGRMKGINYLAAVIKSYRQAIDSYLQNPEEFHLNPEWIEELGQVYHRKYCTGFYFESKDDMSLNYKNLHGGKIHSFIGKVKAQAAPSKHLIEVRNKITLDDRIEILSPKRPTIRIDVFKLFDINGNIIDQAHPNTTVIMQFETSCGINDIIRKT
ncbi:MAG: U32 family peptidase [Desulfobacteraceae bacterium]|nr:U32 family peptidase [Desulfobacteraceae bacterium]